MVVMPDYLHMVLAPKCDAEGLVSVSEIMQAIKGVSAHRINLGWRGKVWEEESFDHLKDGAWSPETDGRRGPSSILRHL